jgi:hypothetical protein
VAVGCIVMLGDSVAPPPPQTCASIFMHGFSLRSWCHLYCGIAGPVTHTSLSAHWCGLSRTRGGREWLIYLAASGVDIVGMQYWVAVHIFISCYRKLSADSDSSMGSMGWIWYACVFTKAPLRTTASVVGVPVCDVLTCRHSWILHRFNAWIAHQANSSNAVGV